MRNYRLVYSLYGLTQEEIAIVEGKGFDRSNISKLRAFYLAYPIVDALYTHRGSDLFIAQEY